MNGTDQKTIKAFCETVNKNLLNLTHTWKTYQVPGNLKQIPIKDYDIHILAMVDDFEKIHDVKIFWRNSIMPGSTMPVFEVVAWESNRQTVMAA